MIAVNYRVMAAKLTAGIRTCTSYFGERLTGTIALMSDFLADGTRSAFMDRLPGHPQQAPDAVDQSGSDAGLFRYRGESLASWKSRVGDPWAFHEQAGTDIGLLRELDHWGSTVYPATWVNGQCYLIEYQWSRFALFIPTGLVGWGRARTYGSGFTYGSNVLYGLDAPAEDIATFRAIVRRNKPARSRASGVIVLTGFVYGQHGKTYGSGLRYGGGFAIRMGFEA